MSSYTVTTNFLSKDALISGNPLKLVKGADLTVEFNNIATACNSKQDASTAAVLQTGTFTGTLTGMTATITGTMTYSIVGNVATISAPGGASFVGTSNSTAMTMTGLPPLLQPATLVAQIVTVNIEDNGVNTLGGAQITNGSGTITFLRSNAAGSAATIASNAFTNTGTKGLNGTVLTYLLT